MPSKFTWLPSHLNWAATIHGNESTWHASSSLLCIAIKKAHYKSFLLNLFPANLPTREHDFFSHFFSFSCWKWRTFTNFTVKKYSQITGWRKTFSFSFSALFFSQSFKEDNQVVFCPAGKRLIQYSAFGPFLLFACYHQVNKKPYEGHQYPNVCGKQRT